MCSAKFLGMAFLIGILVLTGCTRSPAPTKNSETGQATSNTEAQASDITPLFSRIWRVTKAPTPPPSGSIYIFLTSGTLLETSCVETYRITMWSLEKDAPRELRVVEDRQLAFTARIEELTNTSLRLQRRLARGNVRDELTLTAVEGEFVCPDMPKGEISVPRAQNPQRGSAGWD